MKTIADALPDTRRGGPTASPDGIEVRESDRIAIVQINRPRRRNALTRQLRQELTELMNEVGRGGGFDAVVLASGGSGFSAGQDLAEAKDFDVADIPSWIDEHMALYRSILSCNRPVIAAVDGCCVGAGLQVALLCDLRVAARTSYFMMPELENAIPCILGVWTLWDIIGRSRTTEMVLTNRPVGAEEAKSWGLVNQVVESERIQATAIGLARQMAAKPALAFRLTKQRLSQLLLLEADSLAVHAQYAHGVAFASLEPAEAMKQFLDRGRPLAR